jgi:hypothetical protein
VPSHFNWLLPTDKPDVISHIALQKQGDFSKKGSEIKFKENHLQEDNELDVISSVITQI